MGGRGIFPSPCRCSFHGTQACRVAVKCEVEESAGLQQHWGLLSKSGIWARRLSLEPARCHFLPASFNDIFSISTFVNSESSLQHSRCGMKRLWLLKFEVKLTSMDLLVTSLTYSKFCIDVSHHCDKYQDSVTSTPVIYSISSLWH